MEGCKGVQMSSWGLLDDLASVEAVAAGGDCEAILVVGAFLNQEAR